MQLHLPTQEQNLMSTAYKYLKVPEDAQIVKGQLKLTKDNIYAITTLVVDYKRTRYVLPVPYSITHFVEESNNTLRVPLHIFSARTLQGNTGRFKVNDIINQGIPQLQMARDRLLLTLHSVINAIPETVIAAEHRYLLVLHPTTNELITTGINTADVERVQKFIRVQNRKKRLLTYNGLRTCFKTAMDLIDSLCTGIIPASTALGLNRTLTFLDYTGMPVTTTLTSKIILGLRSVIPYTI